MWLCLSLILSSCLVLIEHKTRSVIQQQPFFFTLQQLMIFNLIILDKNKIGTVLFVIHYFTINLFQLCSGWMSNNSSFTSLFLLGFIFYHGIRGDCIVSDVGSCLQVNGYIGVWKSKIYCTLLG